MNRTPKRKFVIFFIVPTILITTVFICYAFISDYRVSEQDFTIIEGILSNEPIIIKDVETKEHVAVNFSLEGEDGKFSLRGKFLKLSDPKIYDLKSGDQIRFHIKKSASKSILENFIKGNTGIWALQKVNNAPILELKTTINYTTNYSRLIWTFLIIIAAMIALAYIFRLQ